MICSYSGSGNFGRDWKSAFEEGEQDTGNNPDLTGPENEHPFDEGCFDRGQPTFKFFLGKSQKISAFAFADPSQKLNQSVGSLRRPISLEGDGG